jgi:hypothetical protein
VTQVPQPLEPRSQSVTRACATLAASNERDKESIMKANVGGIDRAVRIVAGLGLLSLLFLLEGGARWWGLVGLLPLATGTFRFCPAYVLFGMNTCPLEAKKA